MFLDEILRQQIVNSKLSNCKCLDLCAAPGGKSTLLRAALQDDCILYSNEPIRNRASILLENVTKWGYPNHYVTNLYPRDYRKAKMKFDLILCDVPCSGEGMFRKDEATIREWSPQNVDKCWQLQDYLYIVPVLLIQKRMRRTSAGCSASSTMPEWYPSTPSLGGTSQDRCSTGSMNLSTVLYQASREAKGFSCASYGKTGLRLTLNEITARHQRDYGLSPTRLRLVKTRQ